MVCTPDELVEWEDFPKGLRVLLLDRDVNYASEIRSKLEGMDYIVSTFCDEDEALSAAFSNSEVFHVAIVEVSTVKCDGSFKFLQMAKGLPTVMTASAQCLTTTMKCIALGAIEVLNKPICEDKLRNIWQHVVHKAYSAVAESPKQESTIRMVKDEEIRDKLRGGMPCLFDGGCNDEHDRSPGDDKYPAPSTPQLKQVRLLDDAGCHDQTNWSSEKDSVAHYEESKSVETTSCNAAPDMSLEAGEQMHESVVKEENNSADGCKSESDTFPGQKNEAETSSLGGNTRKQSKVSESPSPCGAKTNRKKMKVDWTSDLHKKFVQAVEQLGVDQAIPSRILELMKVEGLTRHNVASHLQKYRMHRRHALPKREERRISVRPKDTMQSSYYYQHKPVMAYPPPYHSNLTLLANQACPVWATPGSHTSGLHAWGPPYQTWPWKTCAAADVWGCPVMPPLHGSYSYYPQQNGYNGGVDISRNSMPPNSHNDHHLADEVVNHIVKEAISKPWLPLPLGLKPPSTESVLSELSKQGISSIPPPSQ
uniref:Two-component response regulator-like APRR2 n=1 Tax=Kalanchoe fedtschenkoi TaxID=63787 RepID=A0A7N0U4A2_KALFE